MRVDIGDIFADDLKALGLRTRGVRVVSCPSCSRQGFDVIRTVEALEARLEFAASRRAAKGTSPGGRCLCPP